MTHDGNLGYSAIQARNRKDGLTYGLLAGAAFALSAWGLDALTLAKLASSLPLFKLLAGTAACLLIAGAAGWVTGLSEKPLAGLVLWVLAGAAMAWVAGHLPFEGLSTAAGLIDARFRGLRPFPIPLAARAGVGLLAFIAGALSGIAGGLQMSLLDAARAARTGVARGLTLALCVPFLGLAGISANSMINWPLLEPLVAVDGLIRFARQARATPVPAEQALEAHLGAIKPLGELIDQPQRLRLAGYDDILESFAVDLDLGGIWARCSVLAGQPSFCEATEPMLEEAMACLIRTRGLPDGPCDLSLTPEARQWLLDQIPSLGLSPTVRRSAAWGEVLFAEVQGANGRSHLCRVRGFGPAVIEACDLQAANP